MYCVNEIFSSLQGEGFNTGKPAVFIRLSGCNLACEWCDTSFEKYTVMNFDDIMKKIEPFAIKNIIITGGEPTIHRNFFDLVKKLKNNGYWIALETNGTKGFTKEEEKLFDYISMSPKASYRNLYEETTSLKNVNEVRIVVDDDNFAFCEFIEEEVKAEHYFLSPCSDCNNNFNFLDTIKLLNKLNSRNYGSNWYLSLQTHKFANIP